MGLLFASFVFDLLTLLTACTLGLIIYAKYVYTFWKRQGVPFIKPAFLFGNTKDIIFTNDHISHGFEKIYKQFKQQNVPFGGYYFALRPELMLVDPDVIKHILMKDFDHFSDKGNYSNEKFEPLSAHLFSLGGQKWKNLRTKLSPTFTSGKMKMMFQTLVATSDELNNILARTSQSGEALDIKELLSRFTTDVIGSCAFGIECNCLQSSGITDFRKYSTQVFEPKGMDIVRAVTAELSPTLMKLFNIRMFNKAVSDFFLNTVREVAQYREENNVSRRDFMELLLKLKNKEKLSDDDDTDEEIDHPSDDGKSLTIEQIAAQCFLFFLAGFETSSTTMTFCLYELVRNPEIQEKLRNEVTSVLNKHNGKLTYEAIMEMKYMDQVLNETLRKYPPLGFLMRQCSQDYKLPGKTYTLKKGQIIRISIQGIQRDPEYYPDPDKFDPNRFTEEEKSKRPSCTFMPFGEGPRICIGMRFGLMQSKVGLTVLLRHYRFTLNKKTQVPLNMVTKNVILTPEGGIWLDVHKV